MVIDMNVSKLDTIEQIREFLDGTAEVAFSNPTDALALRTFVTTVLRRYRYFQLSKGPRGGFCRKVWFFEQNRKTGHHKFNDLQDSKFIKNKLCDRSL